MTILQKYLARSYISAFLLGMVVLTFVLSIGLLVKATQLVLKGLDPKLILHFLAVSIPESFSYTIPLAVLVSALLVFGRLSSDGEMSAMKACGVNLWSVVLPIVFFGVLLSALSIFVNSSVAPRGYHARHLIASGAKGTSAIKLLEPGRFIEEFPNMTFWFARKDGNLLHNVLIYDKSKPNLTRESRAEKAFVTVEGNDITLDMHSVRIDPFSENQPGAASIGRMVHTMRAAVAEHAYRPKVGGYLNGELQSTITNLSLKIAAANRTIETRTANIRDARASLAPKKEAADLALEEVALVSNRLVAAGVSEQLLPGEPAYTNAVAAASRAQEAFDEAEADVQREEARLAHMLSIQDMHVKKRSEMRTEFSRRFALGVAPIVFMLIGIPLGIRTSRRESNIGVSISMGVMVLYYAFLIIAKSLAKKPEFFPHIIIWIPSVACLAIALLLIRRNQ